jgi:hypothetical protein
MAVRRHPFLVACIVVNHYHFQLVDSGPGEELDLSTSSAPRAMVTQVFTSVNPSYGTHSKARLLEFESILRDSFRTNSNKLDTNHSHSSIIKTPNPHRLQEKEKSHHGFNALPCAPQSVRKFPSAASKTHANFNLVVSNHLTHTLQTRSLLRTVNHPVLRDLPLQPTPCRSPPTIASINLMNMHCYGTVPRPT